jgi:Reverse transcriptase (RNA-dependent DNA polymerase)
VSEAKSQAYTELYRKLDTKEGENDVYKMAKIRERKTRDLYQVKCIKYEADRLLVKDEEIKNRWRAYFDKLFNDDSEKTAIELDDSIDTNRRFVRRIQESEAKKALKKMKTGKALGPDDIPIEVWRCLGDIAIVWLTKLFNTIFRSNKMPDEWRRSILVPIFKNKGDIQSCTNYRGIKLMSHTMKLWERVIEHRLRKLTTVSKNQFGFMHMIFIDLEKSYDKIPRYIMWWALKRKLVPTKYVTLIKDMYTNVVTCVRACDGESDTFSIKI